MLPLGRTITIVTTPVMLTLHKRGVKDNVVPIVKKLAEKCIRCQL
jgi:hypothetical protein